MGPACCCCRYTLRSNEQRAWCETNGEGSAISAMIEPPDGPDNPREAEFTLNMRPVANNLYDAGTMGPDWKSKRIWYTYIENDRSGTGGSIVDKDTILKWWNGKSSGNGIGTTVATISSYLIDSLAADPDNEHIYFTGKAYPYPDYSANWDIDFGRINYDGTGLTTLTTEGVFRSGGVLGPLAGVGSMLVHRQEQRLYYVKRQNYTTATTDDWVHEICYRDFGSFGTENVIYSAVCFRAFAAATELRLINCLSFDVANSKVYWCEHYQTGGGAQQSNVKRANLDGSAIETLYASADPYHVNFARYSNKEQKIYHEDFDRIVSAPRDGFYRRADDFSLEEQLATDGFNETNGSPYPSPCSSYLWCGYESGIA